MRHPLYVGIMIGLWAAPTMTVAHLVFAVLCTSIIFIGVRFEEHDLENGLPEYKQYKKKCLCLYRMFVPVPDNIAKLGSEFHNGLRPGYVNNFGKSIPGANLPRSDYEVPV